MAISRVISVFEDYSVDFTHKNMHSIFTTFAKKNQFLIWQLHFYTQKRTFQIVFDIFIIFFIEINAP